MTQAKDKRIEEGRKLLVEYEAAKADLPGIVNEGTNTDERDIALVRLLEFSEENARYFLRDLPQRIEELEEALRIIAEGDVDRPVAKPYRTDGQWSKMDKCKHDRAMYEDCGNCIEEFAASLLSEQPETGELADSYLYHNPDSGWEISANHPVDSGEVPDADHIEPISAQVHNLLTEAWSRPDTPQAHGDVERVARALRTLFDDTWDNPDGQTMASVEDFTTVSLTTLARQALSAMRPVSVDREKLQEIRERRAAWSKTMTLEDEYQNEMIQARRDVISLIAMLSAIEGGNDED